MDHDIKRKPLEKFVVIQEKENLYVRVSVCVHVWV